MRPTLDVAEIKQSLQGCQSLGPLEEPFYAKEAHEERKLSTILEEATAGRGD